MNKKLIWGIVIVIIVIVGGYIAYASIFPAKTEQRSTNCSQAKCAPDTITSPAPTSDWKTYTDPKNKISFNYPSNWINYEGGTNFGEPDYTSVQLHLTIGTASVTSIDQYLSITDKIAETGWEGKPSKVVLSSNKMTIDGKEAIQREETWLAAGFDALTTYIKSGDTVYQFSVTPEMDSTPVTNKDKETYNQIISSIKFTN